MTNTNKMPADEFALEDLVDRCGISGVLYMLSEVCALKAEHVRSNWEDEPIARDWDKAQKVLARAQTSVAPLVRSIG